MRIFSTIAGLRAFLAPFRSTHTIGFVPTMGALHSGHLSLIQRATQETDLVVVSIFVNPLQFRPTEDLDRYPRPFDRDRQSCESLGITVLFTPTVEELYGRPADSTENQTLMTTVLPPVSLTQGLCGRNRTGHFQGVATVVTKLFNIVQPTHAYFGEKDAQQLVIIRHLVQELNFPVKVIPCPIVRDAQGLALSSRNQYLSEFEKKGALVLNYCLKQVKNAFLQGQKQVFYLFALIEKTLANYPDFRLEYAEFVDPDTLQPLTVIKEQGLLAMAGYMGNTRLIDNVMLMTRKPIIAIDGPAGAGKSTVTRQVAQQLGLMYLDTGAMYRSITYLALQLGVDLQDESAIAEIASTAQLDLIDTPSGLQVLLNGKDVSTAIRTPEVTAQVSLVAAYPAVREILVQWQRKLGKKGGLVAEGRDIGTTVFPTAEVKIYLTATVAERARRRKKDLELQGYSNIDLMRLEQEIAQRDHRDSTRQIAPLKKAIDSIEIVTDHMTIDQVIRKIVHHYHQIEHPSSS